MSKIQTVVQYYKTTESLSYRKFSEALNEIILEGKVSHQAIKNWVDGKSTPPLGMMLQVAQYSPGQDWRYRFSADVIETIEKNLTTN